MIVDTSAVVAVVAAESDAALFIAALRGEPARMSAASFLEASIVLDRRSPELGRAFDEFRLVFDVEIAPVTVPQANIARQAYRDFGKGSGHPAQLNFGDCFAYALAIDAEEPLLFKGDDFGRTAVRSAL